jgi:Glyoxalase-like domain
MTDKQMITGIDHPIIAVRDMARAPAAYERLGFTVTPRGRHPEWGTGNWCIMFNDDYLELRGIIEPGSTHNLARFLADREGLMGVALSTDNAEASYQALVHRGLKAQPVSRLSREFELPEGAVHPKFALCFVDPADTLGLMWVVLCQHLTPELLRRPAWLYHANGARGVRSVTGVVPDLAEAAERHTIIFGSQAIARLNTQLRIQLNARQAINVVSMEVARDSWPEIKLPKCGENGFLLSVELQVADIATTEKYFTTNGIAFHRSASAIRISPRDSCGVPFEFTES